MANDTKKEDAQRKYSKYQAVKQQMSVLLQERLVLEEKSSELMTCIEAMKRLKTADAGKSVWSPVGAGAFAKAALNDADNFIIGIGAGVFVEEAKDRAIEILENRRREILSYMEESQTEAERLGKEAEALEIELQGMMQ